MAGIYISFFKIPSLILLGEVSFNYRLLKLAAPINKKTITKLFNLLSN